MQTIWKWGLELYHHIEVIVVPKLFIPLSVDIQRGETLCLWGLIDDASNGLKDVYVDVIETGGIVSYPLNPHHFIGTAQLPPYVWHVFCER